MRYLQIKCQKFDLENEGLDLGREKLDFHHSTGYIRFTIVAFQNFNYLATHIYTKGYIHTVRDGC